jgi:hypothetical protein
MLMGANNGAVDEHLFKIRILRQLSEDTMPDTTPRPTGKALINTVPGPELAWQITPWTAGAGNPQTRFNEKPIVGRCTARITGLAWQQRRYPLKLIIAHPHTYHPDSAQSSGYDHKLPSVNSPLVTY